MGSNARPGGVDRDDAPEYADTDEKALPFALVMQRRKPKDLDFTPDLREPGATAAGSPPQTGNGPGSHLVLAK